MANIDYRLNGVVTSPVSVRAVSNLIGDGSFDVGKICRSNKINPYSHRKPIRCSDIVLADSDSVWAAKDWGYWIPEAKSLSAIATWMCGGDMPWTTLSEDDEMPLTECGGIWRYQKPRGGGVYPKEPYRLGDFRGYEHYADRKHFFDGMIRFNGEYHLPLDNTINVYSSNNSITTRFQVGNNLGDEGIAGLYFPTDFASIKDMYLGVIVAYNNGTSTDKALITSSTTLANNGVIDLTTDSQLELLLSTMDQEYTCLFVASSDTYTTPFRNQTSDILRVLPFKPFKMLRKNGTAMITVISENAIIQTALSKTFTVNVRLKNNGLSLAKNVSCKFVYNGRTINVYLDDIAANGGESYKSFNLDKYSSNTILFESYQYTDGDVAGAVHTIEHNKTLNITVPSQADV